MIKDVIKIFPYVKPPQISSFERYLPSAFDNELTIVEKMNKTIEFMNQIGISFNNVVDFMNQYDSELLSKEDKTNLTNKRKLSPNGDFSGTLLGESIFNVFSDIENSLSLSETLIEMVNNRESIGTIYDGGDFVNTEPPTITIDGGTF